jgi:hypothetical protein
MCALAVLLVVLCTAGLAVADDASDDASDGASQGLLESIYNQGFVFTSDDGRFGLRINGLLQLRYSFVDYDGVVVGNEGDYSNFYMRRARLWFRGHAFDERITYFVHLQLEPTRSINAHDLWLEYDLGDLLKVGVGRNKIAYGLEFLNSGAALSMVERSVFSGETDVDLNLDGPEFPGGGTARFGLTWLTDTGFATGGLTLYRSQGLQLSGQRGDETTPTFEYQLGIWNGRSTTGLSNTSDGHLVAARVGWHPWGWVDWRLQGDGGRSDRFRLGVLGSVYTQRGDAGGGFDEGGWNLAAMARWRGLSVDVEWGTESFDYDAWDEDLERTGWRIQAGAFVVRDVLELVARYAEVERLVDPTAAAAQFTELGLASVVTADGTAPALERDISEISVGASWYLNDWHRHKLQLDASRLVRTFAADPDAVIDGVARPIEAAPDQEDWRVRVMVQLLF